MVLVEASQSPQGRSHKVDLQLQLGPPPVSPLCVVPDRVAGPHPERDSLKICNACINPTTI